MISGTQKRSPWGFFMCEAQADAARHVLTVGAPAILAANDEEHALAAPYPDVTLTRPTEAEDRRLAYGPFAFRLSPSSEVLTLSPSTLSTSSQPMPVITSTRLLRIFE